MDLWAQWLVGQIRIHLRNERGQDAIVILLIIFLLWLLISGKKIFVQ
jgi:hypothetical protein